MPIFKIQNSIIIGIFLSLTFTSVSFSADESKIIDSLMNHGQAALDKGDFFTAIDDFSRGLLLDVNNTDLQNRLLSVLQVENLPTETAIQLHLFSDYLYQIINLSRKIDAAREEKDF